jgi:hydrogenase-4 component F
MSLAVLADNLGVLWVAVEATTITTAFLVGHHRTRRALEAAWKYVVLGSVGVAIAFLGIVLLYAATLASGTPTLSWVVLDQANLPMDPPGSPSSASRPRQASRRCTAGCRTRTARRQPPCRD